jgi:hypothetical protein
MPTFHSNILKARVKRTILVTSKSACLGVSLTSHLCLHHLGFSKKILRTLALLADGNLSTLPPPVVTSLSPFQGERATPMTRRHPHANLSNPHRPLHHFVEDEGTWLMLYLSTPLPDSCGIFHWRQALIVPARNVQAPIWRDLQQEPVFP